MKRVIRTCVSCGAKKEKTELVRFVYSEKPEEDTDGNRHGRGAYVCDNEKCRDIGLKKMKLTRSLLCNQLRRTR